MNGLGKGLLAPLPLVLAITACDSGASTGLASPSPSAPPGVVAAGGVLQPPPAATSSALPGTAAAVLQAAAARTMQGGSYRIKISAQLATSNQGTMINGAAEVESASRTHLQLTVAVGGHEVVAESENYDGVTYTRQAGGPWQRTPSGQQPSSSYLNYALRAVQIVDAGGADRNGTPTEKYTGAIDLGGLSTPVPSATQALSMAELAAYVDKTAGHVVAEDITLVAGSQPAGVLKIDFSDFGAGILVTPPDALPSP
ncbi:MAG TPA: hypothetical protein VG329_02430 [Candidatus Dormibacteraeota bacterium]|nr:hypothetical protein [Candidatus Dormibacteraeota bacterium]